MLERLFVSTVFAASCLLMTSQAIGATVTVSEANIAEGTAEATVEWSFENSAEDVTEIFFDITFSTDHIDPQVTEEEVFPGVFEDVPDGCLDNVSGISNAACIVIDDGNPSVIRVSLDNSPNNLPDFVPGGTITFDVDGSAEVGDDTPLELSISSVFPGDADVTLNDGAVNVVDISAVLNVQPTSLDFQTQEVGEGPAGAQPFTISNEGTDDIDLEVSDIIIGGTHAGDFSLVSGGNCPTTFPFSLADGEDCQQYVDFEPGDLGNREGTITVQSDAGQTTNDSVALSGEGTPGPAGDITISADHDFGELLTNEDSEQHTFTVSNNESGGSAVAIDTVSLSGDGQFSIDTEDCDGTSLAPGDTCSVTVEFTPTSDGAVSATLTVSGEDGNGDTRSDTAEATGEGVTEARFSTNPGPNVNLGMSQPGAVLSQNVTVSNNGNADLDLSCGSLDDPDGVFDLSPASIDESIGGGEDFGFQIACELPDVASYSATLSCTTNDPNNETVEYSFSCSGQPLVVPTMQKWGLILFALMMLIAGGIGIRFFRA